MGDATCSIAGCGKGGPLVRGWCQKHYTKWLRHGDPLGGQDLYRPLEDRLNDKIDKNGPGGCWLWTGGKARAGYGSFAGFPAHRVAYEHWVGPIPEGLEIDHLCMVHNCVNPAHLEPVTPVENVRRADRAYGRGSAKTHCPRGHAYDEVNTYNDPRSGRRCRACHRINQNARRARLGRHVTG